MRSFFAVFAFILASGCAPEVAHTEQCTVVRNDGSVTIHCPDGTEATIASYTAVDAGTVLDANVVDAATSVEDAATVVDALSFDVDTSDVALTDADFSDTGEDAHLPDDAGMADGSVAEDAAYEQILYGSYHAENSLDIANLSGYTKITGDLLILDGITTLQGLEHLTEIGGSLIVESRTLTSFHGLSSLYVVEGDLGISDVMGIEGMVNLYSVGGDFKIGDTEISTIPFPNLWISSGAYFGAWNNPNLPNCLVQELIAQIAGRGGISATHIVNTNKDACNEDPCAGGNCVEDCAQPEFYVCQ